MKKIIITALPIISMVMSCSNNSIVSNSEEFLKNDLLDPKSYELIKSDVDTVRKSDLIKEGAESDSSIVVLYIKEVKTQLNFADIWVNSRSDYGNSQYNSYMSMVYQYRDSATLFDKRYKSKLNQYHKLVNTSKDSIVGYDVKLRYYAASREGKRRIGETTIHNTRDGKPFAMVNTEQTKI